VPLPISQELFLRISADFELAASYLGTLASANADHYRTYDSETHEEKDIGKLSLLTHLNV
jgi:hypothetical protein